MSSSELGHADCTIKVELISKLIQSKLVNGGQVIHEIVHLREDIVLIGCHWAGGKRSTNLRKDIRVTLRGTGKCTIGSESFEEEPCFVGVRTEVHVTSLAHVHS